MTANGTGKETKLQFPRLQQTTTTFRPRYPPTFTRADWMHFSLSVKYLNFITSLVHGHCADVLRQQVRMPQSRRALQHEAVKDVLHNCVTIFILCNSPQLAGKLTYLKEHCVDPICELDYAVHHQWSGILGSLRGDYHRQPWAFN